jgi:hypothetical protein
MAETERMRLEFDGYLEDLFVAAETATNGHMIRRAFEDTVDPRSFFWRNGPLHQRAMSEDLERYFADERYPGTRVPLTFTEYCRSSRQVA